MGAGGEKSPRSDKPHYDPPPPLHEPMNTPTPISNPQTPLDEARAAATFWRDAAAGNFAKHAVLPWEDLQDAPPNGLVTRKSPSARKTQARPPHCTNEQRRLSPARQNAMLSRMDWEGNRIRCVCTARTEPLLRLAGISLPCPLEAYLLPVIRDNSGFLVVDTSAHPEPHSQGLFGRGEILEGLEDLHRLAEKSRLAHLAEGLTETRAIIHGDGRRFEVATDSHSKVLCILIALDDQALPSPQEPERWVSRDPADAEIITAVQTLAMAGVHLAKFERP